MDGKTLLVSMMKWKVGIGLLGLILLTVLVASACGGDTMPTSAPPTEAPAPTEAPEPTAMSEPTAMPEPTAMSEPTAMPEPTAMSEPTAMPEPTPSGPRPLSQWTADNPATLAEIEAELEKRRGETINLASWGGAWQAAERQAYMDPVRAKFGINIVEDNPISLSKIRTMVETNNVTWDIANYDTIGVHALGPEGTLEEFNPGIHNGYLQHYPEVTRTAWSGGGGVYWSTGLAYSLESFPDASGPKNWADFWDIEKFPGRRGIGDRPQENMFFAYLAAYPEVLDSTDSKIAHSKLTDAQIDEAFAKLEDLKPDITVFWSSGSDCPQLLISGELDMCTAWNGRIADAQQGEGGESLYYCWECGHLLQGSVFFIPKGSPNAELAQLYIAWTGFAENNVRIANYISYGPINQQAVALLESEVGADRIANLPTSPQAVVRSLVLDEKWLGENTDRLVERYQAYLQE